MIEDFLDAQLAGYNENIKQMQDAMAQADAAYVKHREDGLENLNQLIGASKALQILKSTKPEEPAPDIPVVSVPSTTATTATEQG